MAPPKLISGGRNIFTDPLVGCEASWKLTAGADVLGVLIPGFKQGFGKVEEE